MDYRFSFRKFSCSRLIALVICLGAVSASAEISGDWEYSYYDSTLTATVTKYNGSEISVTIPSTFHRTITYQEQDDDGEWHTRHRTYTYTVTATHGTFKNNSSIISVSLPSTVITIGDETFRNCSALLSPPIHFGVKVIGSWAFAGCSRFTEVTTPSSLQSLGNGAFAYCGNLSTVTIDGQGLTIPEDAFAQCTSLHDFTAGDGVTRLNAGSGGIVYTSYWSPFAGCSSLETVTVGTGVTTISPHLFRSLLGLRTVVFRGNVTQIGGGAFFKCSNLENLTINGSPTSIGGGAFEGCSLLTTLPSGWCPISVGEGAFKNCNRLTGAIDFSQCESIGRDAFRDCTVWAFGSLTLPKITAIGAWAFAGCPGLTDVTTPSSLQSLENGAFAYCGNLLTVTIDGQGLTIPEDAFAQCTSLHDFTAGDGVTRLYAGSGGIVYTSYWSPFGGCSSLETVTVGTGVSAISPHLFRSRLGLRTVVFRGNVTQIGDGAFYGCSNLENLAINGNPTSIGGGAFEGCSLLTTLPSGWCPVSIGGGAFKNCKRLTGAIDFSQCESIGGEAFRDCTVWAFGRLSLSKVKSIGDWAFAGCSKLTEVSFASSLTVIGSKAFGWCGGLTSITLPSSLKTLGSGSFTSCGNLEFAIIDGDGLSISEDVFNSCTALKSVTIGNGVVNLRAWVSSGIGGTSFYSPFSRCSSLETVEVGTGVTTVQGHLFRNLASLKTVTFLGNIEQIGDGAFYGCSNLENLTINGNPTSIGGEAFKNCKRLTGAFDFSQCESIGGDAFRDCTVWAFGCLSLPKAKTIGSWAFAGCTGLIEVAISSPLQSLGSYAFSWCPNLSKASIDSEVSQIGEGLFYVCPKLANVSIGKTSTAPFFERGVLCLSKTVATIFKGAFKSCSSLADVVFEGSPPYCYSEVFSQMAPVAHGHYPRTLASEWLPQIGSDGKWNGLIMHELTQPVLRVKSANPAEGSITLAWDDGTDGQCVSSYSIYRSANDAFTEADRVATGITATEWTDANYWNAEPVLSPLNYWVVAESNYFDLPASNAVETRHRYGFAVGVNVHSSWNIGNADNIQLANDANAFGNLAMSSGNFKRDNIRVLTGSDANHDKVRSTLADLRENAAPGDIFVMFMSTHGSFGLFDSKPKLAMYGVESYTAAELLQDVRAFDSGVSVVGVIMACHAQAMIGNGGASTDSTASDKVASWLLDAGMASCPVNVAWVTSCGYDENSLLGSTSSGMSPFGSWFFGKGWSDGCADRLLHGASWGGGDRDGKVSFLELAKYSEVFSHGYSDDLPSGVCYENESLLTKVFAGTAGTGTVCHRPDAPISCIAAKGSSDSGIEVNWDTPSDASIMTYWLFRAEKGESAAKCICRYARNGRFNDPKSIYGDWKDKPSIREPKTFNEYDYFVKTVNECGISDASPSDSGYRGTDGLVSFLVNAASSLLLSGTTAELAETPSANGLTLEQCYVAGISPTNAAARFEARIEFDAAGKPVVKWTPDLNEGGTKDERAYRVLGAKALGASASWDDVTDLADPDAAGYRFFKAAVALPE